MDIAELLAFTVKNNASDLHLSSGLPPMIRVDGDIRRLTLPALDTAQLQELIYSTMSDKHRRDFEANLEVDYSYSVQGLARFRVNCFHHDRGVGGAFRTIPDSVWTLEDIGSPPIFRDIIDAPRGLILMTGPTGSGKTVSLYTGLNILNSPDRNISTCEDPVEINLMGVNQVNVNPKAGLDFSLALRAFLRQDPDIIMVGEIRDLETAEIAVKAAQTGHLVLSTLHTNDAPQTLTRLANMGVPPYNIASAVHLIMAQRLARRLCNSCKKEVDIPKESLLKAGFREDQLDELKIFGAVGCDHCTLGYKGRVGIYQVMPVSEEMGRIIMEGGNSMQLAHQSHAEGVADLRESGLRKVAAGITSLEEIDRVTKE